MEKLDASLLPSCQANSLLLGTMAVILLTSWPVHVNGNSSNRLSGLKRTVGTRAGVWCVLAGMLAATGSDGAH